VSKIDERDDIAGLAWTAVRPGKPEGLLLWTTAVINDKSHAV